MRAAERLRDAGLKVILHAGESSLKSRWKRADASGGALRAVIVGEQEAAADVAAVKALRASDPQAAFAQQRTVALDSLASCLNEAIRSEG